MSHSKSISAWGFSTQQSYSPRSASECPGWNEVFALLHPVSPLAGCKAWRLLGHQVESALLILIHCTDWSNVTGSLAKIPGSISCKKERSKTGLQRWEAGSLKHFGGLHINTALKNGHCWTVSSAQGLYWTLGWVKAWSYRTLKPECGIWLITSTLLSLWGEILSPPLFLKSGTRNSPSRNLESELLKPLLLKKIENSHYFGIHDILTWGWAELWKKGIYTIYL